MAGETTRTITKHGRFSGVVAIPTDYRRYHHLEPGTEVKVLYDNLLLIIPPGAEGKVREHKELIRRLLE
ncbi:MAG: hypothetical protein MUO36_03895 [Candidatus Hadarchaeum sp.]|nr:hypothetical protein [Candidatus Hadarchaeum sp.]